MQEFPVTVRFSVKWGEMDALGHVNNARFFTWFEEARMAYFARVAMNTESSGVGPILASTQCDFLKPVVYPAELLVGASVTRLGRSSFDMAYAVANAADPEERFARGKGVVVTIDYRTHKTVPIPDTLRQAIEALG